MSSPNKKKSKKQSDDNKNVEKLKRKQLQEQQKRIKPGECMKYIRCIIDPEFLDPQFGSNILTELQNNQIKYIVQNQKIPKIISWQRSNQQMFTESNSIATMTEKFNPEKSIIHIIPAEIFLIAIKENTLKENIKLITKEYPDTSLTIIIYGMKNFTQKSNNEIEEILTEIQIEYNCCHRYYETSAEIAQTIVQFSKAISEIPFKKQQAEKFNDMDAFVLNDNKDCVRVEGTAGLSRLWQNHLTRLPLVTLEVAESIITEYSNPLKLLKAYDNNTKDEGVDLLSDIKIRRTTGPLQANRRLGPELSRKIYTLYNTLDPNETL